MSLRLLMGILGAGAPVDFGTDFAIEVATTGSPEDISVPTGFSPTTTHNAVIDWGDGTPDSIITAFNDPDLTHSYASAGDHVIRISGDFPIIDYFSQSQTDRNKVRRILNWGETGFETMRRAIYRCQGLTSVTSQTADTSLVTDMLECFLLCDAMTECDVTGWDVSSVTDMGGMFSFTDDVVSQDFSNWDSAAVLNMTNMFSFCDNRETIITSSLFVGPLCTNIRAMFIENFALTTITDVANWDVSAVTDMRDVFGRCTSLATLDVSTWDTSSVLFIGLMFRDCDLLTDLAIDNWDITALINANNFMFEHVGLNTARYDDVLIAWDAQAVNNNINVSFGLSKYTSPGAAATARANLIADHSWVISDGGIA
jgi:surface protein